MPPPYLAVVFAARNFDTKETGQRAMEFGSEFRSKYINDSMKIYNEIRFVSQTQPLTCVNAPDSFLIS